MKPESRIGRPTKAVALGEQASLGLRVTAELKNRLEKAAEESGRTQSKEAEYRLQAQFDSEEQRVRLLDEVMTLAYGPRLAALLQLTAAVLEEAGSYADIVTGNWKQFGAWKGAWMINPYAFSEAKNALNKALDCLAPTGVIEPPAPLTDAEEKSKFFGMSSRSYLLHPEFGIKTLAVLRGDQDGDTEVRQFVKEMRERIQTNRPVSIAAARFKEWSSADSDESKKGKRGKK